MPKVSKPADLGPIPGGRCPCSRLCEIRITRGIDLYVYSADRAKTPLKIAETQRNVYKIDNPADGPGVVIWAEAGHQKQNRHIFPHADLSADPPVVTLHEVMEGFPKRATGKAWRPKPAGGNK